MPPLTLILLLGAVNHAGIMGRHRNSRLANAAGVLLVLVIFGLSPGLSARVFGLGAGAS